MLWNTGQSGGARPAEETQPWGGEGQTVGGPTTSPTTADPSPVKVLGRIKCVGGCVLGIRGDLSQRGPHHQPAMSWGPTTSQP